MPNPFDTLGEGLVITIESTPIVLSPELLNWLADPIIAGFTFAIVGLYYIRSSNPSLGSILYMVFYAIHLGLLYLISSAYPTMWLMVLIGIAYIGLHVIAIILKHKFD